MRVLNLLEVIFFLYRLAIDIGNGVWVEKGIPKGEISSQDHIDICKDLLVKHYLPKVNIPELFLIDVDETVELFRNRIQTSEISNDKINEPLRIIQDPEFRRNKSSVRNFSTSDKNWSPQSFLSH